MLCVCVSSCRANQETLLAETCRSDSRESANILHEDLQIDYRSPGNACILVNSAICRWHGGRCSLAADRRALLA
jgi:hypothetical protein